MTHRIMAREPRKEFPYAFYHVMSRGNEKRRIYETPSDKRRFLDKLEEATEKFNIKIFAYCLMENHYHLLVETLEANLSKAMHFINNSYVKYFNKKTERVGHLFASRYKAIIVDKDAYAMELSRYIHLNPVKAKMVKRPEDYKWSSYLDYLGKRESPWLDSEWILELFSNEKKQAQIRFKTFVKQGIGINGEIKDPTSGNVKKGILGNSDFVNKVTNQLTCG